MTTSSISEQIEQMRESAAILIAAAAEYDEAADESGEDSDDADAEILAADWDESKYARAKDGKFSSGGGGGTAVKSASPGPMVKSPTSAVTPKSAGGALVKSGGGGGGLVKTPGGGTAGKKSNKLAEAAGIAAMVAGAVVGGAVGAAVVSSNEDSIRSGLSNLGDKASAARIAGVGAAVDGVKAMNTKVKGAMAGLSKKLGMDGGKDSGKSGGAQLVESVAKMGAAVKSGSQKAMQLTAARAATAVAAAQNETVRNAFVDKLKKAKNGQEVIDTIHGAAAAIDTDAHIKVGTDNAKKAIGEHAADIGKGTAAAVAIGAAVMASKKFAKGGAAKTQGALAGAKAQKALPGKSAPKALPPGATPKNLPPGVRGGALAKAGENGVKSYGAIVKPGSNSAPKKGLGKAAAAAAAVAVGVAGLGATVAANKEKSKKE